MVIFVPPDTDLKVKQVMYSQNIDIPFTADITFSDRRTGEKIKTVEVEGQLTGVAVQKFEADIYQTKITEDVKKQ